VRKPRGGTVAERWEAFREGIELPAAAVMSLDFVYRKQRVGARGEDEQVPRRLATREGHHTACWRKGAS
jgi:hypothetical protein